MPVVLLGTFGVMAAAGYSINTLTLFGLVLAIGLLVDDAIVVVENVERVMQEEGLSPKEATRKSMDQISGALVGIGLVLCAAFVPMAFFTGSSGVIYRQFSLTIASSVALSVMVALILTPALCATMLKPIAERPSRARSAASSAGSTAPSIAARTATPAASARFSGTAAARSFSTRSSRVVVVVLFLRAPTGFLPDEDTGVLFAMAQLPPGSTREQADEVLKKMENHFFENEKDLIEGGFGVLGFSFSGNGQNQVLMFREAQGLGGAPPARAKSESDPGPRDGRSSSQYQGGLRLRLRAAGRAGAGHRDRLRRAPRGPRRPRPRDAHERAQSTARHGHAESRASPKCARTASTTRPCIRSISTRKKRARSAFRSADINASLSTILGSTYVNDFIDKGRVKKVFVQGDAPFRMLPEDVNRWYVRNAQGGMVPFSAFSTAQWTLGSPKLERFNGSPSVVHPRRTRAGPQLRRSHARDRENGQAAAPRASASSGPGFPTKSGSPAQSAALYIIALLMVFLCLAALYESWAIPFSVMMDMPLGALGVVAATNLRGMPNDIYFQIGLITIIGLSAKNAILVVEFAKEHFDRGATLVDAALHAVRQRLRPILMTSIAFGLGVLPLALAKAPAPAARTRSAPASSAAPSPRRFSVCSLCRSISSPCCAFQSEADATRRTIQIGPKTENLDDEEAPEQEKELAHV